MVKYYTNCSGTVRIGLLHHQAPIQRLYRATVAMFTQHGAKGLYLLCRSRDRCFINSQRTPSLQGGVVNEPLKQ